MSSLIAKNLWKSFPHPQGGQIEILKGVSLTLQIGESLAISGRSGEGKTTLLHILGGLESPDRGVVSINNTPLSFHQPALRGKNIGFIFQSFQLFHEYTVLENVLLPARIARQSVKKGSFAWMRACDLLARVGLEQHVNRLMKTLSGGEKQRAALARALLNHPHFILADEPSGNLDAKHAKEIGILLQECVQEEQKGLILVTHDPILAAMCQKQLHLQDGIVT